MSSKEKLGSIDQGHLLSVFSSLPPQQQERLLSQIEALDIAAFRGQQRAFETRMMPIEERTLSPVTEVQELSDASDVDIRETLHDVGCILVAGGGGSRLGFGKSKGMFPITPIKKKSFFQLFLEKTKAASKAVGVPLPLAIMTSPINHSDIVSFIEENDYFDLPADQVHFFSQQCLPFLDDDGNIMTTDSGSIAVGADGNGSMYRQFCFSPIYSLWKEKGIRFCSVIPVENPLADPFDAAFIDVHKRRNNDITIKCVLRDDPDESVGILVLHDDKVCVMEYIELSDEIRTMKSLNGSLLYSYANLGIYCLSLDFFPKVKSLPFHIVQKPLPDDPQKRSGWKCERFSFDTFPLSDRVGIVVSPRECCFAPLKQSEGPYGCDYVRAAIQRRDREVFASLSGQPAPPDAVFELDQQFYYPTESLRRQWKGKRLPGNVPYIIIEP